MIIKNENKNISRIRKRRIDRRNKINDDMKLFLKKYKSERKRNIKVLIKLKN